MDETPNELARRLRVLGLRQAGYSPAAIVRKMRDEEWPGVTARLVDQIIAAARKVPKKGT